MTARRINLETNTVQEVSDDEFFAGIFGHAPRTREQVQAEWDAKVQRCVEQLLRGCELSDFGNPAVREARELIALRDAEATGDPLLPKNRRAA
jgi:hypothetical protein